MRIAGLESLVAEVSRPNEVSRASFVFVGLSYGYAPHDKWGAVVMNEPSV
jgi:hypothetical protein